METQQVAQIDFTVEQARLAAEAEKLAATLVQAQEQGLDPTLQTEVATEDIGRALPLSSVMKLSMVHFNLLPITSNVKPTKS